MASEATGGEGLVFDRDMQRAELCRVAGGAAALFSARCPAKETPNEDAAAIFPLDQHSAVLAVADGLGGVAAGEHAARLALETLQSCLQTALARQLPLRTAILDGIEKANQTIQELAVGAATTLAVVEIQHQVARPYHVGDSMILLTGQRGRVKWQTVSHSPVGYAVEAGVLDAKDAMHHEDRHLVSNVLGAAEMRIEIGPAIRLADRDTLLLASDGLCDNLHLGEIVQHARTGTLARVSQRLVAQARQRMNRPAEGQPSKPDDLTFIAFRPRAHRRDRFSAP